MQKIGEPGEKPNWTLPFFAIIIPLQWLSRTKVSHSFTGNFAAKKEARGRHSVKHPGSEHSDRVQGGISAQKQRLPRPGEGSRCSLRIR